MGNLASRKVMREWRHLSLGYTVRLRLYLVVCLALSISGCGGGGGSSSTGVPSVATADFTLSVSPTSSFVSSGNSTSVSLSAAAVNGFSAQIAVQITGLPAGVAVSPPTISLTPGIPLQLTLSEASNVPSTTGTVTFTGTSGSKSHSTQLNLSVFGALSSIPPSRTRYVRADAVTEYFLWLNTHWIVYGPANSRFFMTDPEGNQVLVFDAKTQTKIGSISVPGAFGMDDTPDHNTLYVGTLIGDVYSIDEATMAVTHRYLASQIGPYGYRAFSALGLADGRLALLGAQGGIPSVDGSPSFAIWSPTDNSITVYTSTYGSAQLNGIPATRVCGGFMGNIGGFTRTADRTKIIVGSIDSDTTLCEVDASTGQDNYVEAVGTFSTRSYCTTLRKTIMKQAI
jgi:hypothetical protein